MERLIEAVETVLQGVTWISHSIACISSGARDKGPDFCAYGDCRGLWTYVPKGDIQRLRAALATVKGEK